MLPTRRAKDLLTRLTRPLAALGRRFGQDGQIIEEIAAAARFDDRVVAEDFSLTLEQMLVEDAGAFQLKLQIISLVQFREAVGDKWARLSEKVMLIAEGVIAQHLGPGNTSGRIGEDVFVLLFRAVSADEGRRRAYLIVRDLGGRLLGDQFSAGDEPMALAAEVDLGALVDGGGKIDLAVLDRSVAEARARLAIDPAVVRQIPRLIESATAHEPDRFTTVATSSGSGHDRDPTDWKATGAAGAAGADEPQWGKLHRPEGAKGPGEPGWRALPERPRDSGADPDWGALHATPARRSVEEPLWQRLIPGGTDLTPPVAAPDLPPGATVGLRWRPTWTARPTESIGAYLARIHRRDPAQEYQGTLAYPEEGGETAFTLDRALIGATVRLFSAVPPPDATLILPLHWASVVDARRLSLLAPLAALPEARRAGLALDLFGVPEDVSRHDLGVVIQALRPLAGQVLLRVSPEHPRAPRAADCGAQAIGLDFDQLSPVYQADPAVLADLLADLRAKTAATGLGCYAWGVRSRAGMVAAILGGYSWVNGPSLMRDFPRPERTLPAPRERFADLAKDGAGLPPRTPPGG